MMKFRNEIMIVLLLLVAGLMIGLYVSQFRKNSGDAYSEMTRELFADSVEAIIVDQTAEIANLDSCLVMCHEQLMFTHDQWRECEHILDCALAEPMPLPSLYDSTVVIDGIIYERALGSRTAWNNGVLEADDENQ